MSVVASQYPVWQGAPASGGVPPQYDDYLDDLEEEQRRSPFVSAFLLSSVVHTGIMIALATVFFDPPPDPLQLVVTIPVEEETLPEEPTPVQIFRFTKEELPEIGSPSVAGIETPASSADRVNEVASLRTEENPVESAKFDAPVSVDISQAPHYTTDVRIKGNAGVGAIGAVGAVDRITQEILLSLEERPTLVVWFFDKSWSMLPQRKEINQRFDRVYKELGVSHLVAPRLADKPLVTSVVAFGEKVEFMTPQLTDNLEEIKAAVDAIQNDPSGVEMTFTALGMAAEKYKVHHQQSPKRNILFVLFTDEVGDDEQVLESVVSLCRVNAIRVYVVGTPAPFGRRNIEFKYVDPDPNYDQSVQWLPVRAGPETFKPEQVQLGFTGMSNRDASIYRLDSGFGPFSLTRLCYETGGIFFSVHPARPLDAEGFVPRSQTPPMSPAISFFFDPVVMRPYAPDYVPASEYERLLSLNRAKQALVRTAEQSMVGQMDKPPLMFTRNPENEAALKRALDEAQKKAAILEPRLNVLYQALKQGEADRGKITEPRWQAGFDLALGRVLAAKVRTEAYNLILAKAKFGLKLDNPQTNRLEVRPVDEITVGSQHQKFAKQATDLLEGVIRDHAGTPWAYLAAEELKEPMGWKWIEHYDPPPPAPPKATARPTTTPPPNNRPQGLRPIPPNATPKPIRQNVKL